MKDELYFLEYSVKQKFYHLGSVKQSLSINLNAVLSGKSLDYVPIGIGTLDEMSALSDELRRKHGLKTKLE